MGFPKFTFSFSFIRDYGGQWGGKGDTWQCIFCWNKSGKLLNYILGKEKISNNVRRGIMELSVFQAITLTRNEVKTQCSGGWGHSPKATLKSKYKVKRSNLQISTLLPSGQGAPLVELKPKVSQARICRSPCTYNCPTFGVVFHTKTRGVHSIFCLASWPWDHDSPAPSKARSGQSMLTVSLLAGFHSTQAYLEPSLPTWLAFARASSWEAWMRTDLLVANSQNSWESLEM